MPQPPVWLQSVSKLYGRFAALRKVSLNLAQPGCYVLLGENGAGKSTLLRVIAGLIAPTQGTLTILGATPQQARSKVGYMSHAPMLYDELSAQENLAYFAGLYPAQTMLSPDEALRAVNLDPALSRPVGQYSQGMRQRTSLARVLMPQPQVLLLDEPFSNMDIASAQQMVALIGAMSHTRTVLMTTHQRGLAEPIAHSLLTMQAGSIVSIERGPRHTVIE